MNNDSQGYKEAEIVFQIYGFPQPNWVKYPVENCPVLQCKPQIHRNGLLFVDKNCITAAPILRSVH